MIISATKKYISIYFLMYVTAMFDFKKTEPRDIKVIKENYMTLSCNSIIISIIIPFSLGKTQI